MLGIILKLIFKGDLKLREKEKKILKRHRHTHIINANIRIAEDERKRFLAKEEDRQTRKWQEKAANMKHRIRTRKELLEEKGKRTFGKEL